MFLRNCWYVAAWSHEVEAGKLLARRIVGEPLVIYRQEGGSPVAMEDRCCHRHAPLSLGRQEGSAVRCMYHGWKYSAAGICVEIPGQSRIPEQARVRTYPAVERHSWIWVWMGAADKADESLIPAATGLDNPDWNLLCGSIAYQANYRLVLDNLLDFSHLSYVHQATFGGNDKWASIRPAVSRKERGVSIQWTLDDISPAPFAKAIGFAAERNDLKSSYDFIIPGVLLMTGLVRPHGEPFLDGEKGVMDSLTCQAVTPETEQTSRYFFSFGPRREVRDPAIAEGMMAGARAAFEEDRVMIEAQQRIINLAPDRPKVPMTADRALGQFRWLLDKLIEEENSRRSD